ncbi:regulatory particle non-ATPase [Microsporum canis]
MYSSFYVDGCSPQSGSVLDLANTTSANDTICAYAFQCTPQRYISEQEMSHFLAATTAQQLHQQADADSPAGLEPVTPDRVSLLTRRSKGATLEADTSSCSYHGRGRGFGERPCPQEDRRQTDHAANKTKSQSIRGLSARNSQAGPHRCGIPNPSTGRPCNTIFSRPYDLTRHENTIHNTNKRKIHCHRCGGTKTFSRNDALIRHMRTAHPETNYPPAEKRRSRAGVQ